MRCWRLADFQADIEMASKKMGSIEQFLSRMYFAILNKQGGSVDDVTDQTKGVGFIEQYKMRHSVNTI